MLATINIVFSVVTSILKGEMTIFSLLSNKNLKANLRSIPAVFDTTIPFLDTSLVSIMFGKAVALVQQSSTLN
jgi:hypothetical protein